MVGLKWNDSKLIVRSGYLIAMHTVYMYEIKSYSYCDINLGIDFRYNKRTVPKVSVYTTCGTSLISVIKQAEWLAIYRNITYAEYHDFSALQSYDVLCTMIVIGNILPLVVYTTITLNLSKQYPVLLCV